MNLHDKIKSFIDQILIIIFYIAINILLSGIFYTALISEKNIIVTLCYILIDLIILTSFIFIFRKTIVPDFYDFKKNGKKYINSTYQYYILGLLIMFVSNYIISFFMGMPVNEEANREMINNIPIYSVLAVVIFAPITEELLTRTILKDTFKHYYIYILLSGLIFGSLHVLSVFNSHNYLELLYIIPYGALGCGLAKIYHNSNNVWTNIFFHSLHNFICILIIFLGGLL